MRIAKSCLGLFLRRQLEKVSSGRTILFTCSNGKNRACGLYRGRSRRERSPFCSPVPSTKLHPNHRGLWSEVMRRREKDERSRSTNEGGMSQYCPHFRKGWPEKSPSRGRISPIPWRNKLYSGQACRSCRGSCSPIRGRDCSGDIPGTGSSNLPPPQFVERLKGPYPVKTAMGGKGKIVRSLFTPACLAT